MKRNIKKNERMKKLFIRWPNQIWKFVNFCCLLLTILRLFWRWFYRFFFILEHLVIFKKQNIEKKYSLEAIIMHRWRAASYVNQFFNRKSLVKQTLIDFIPGNGFFVIFLFFISLFNLEMILFLFIYKSEYETFYSYLSAKSVI